MSRELRWDLTEEQVCEAIQEWVERQGDVVSKVRIENPNKASTIRFIVECDPPPLKDRFAGISKPKRIPALND